MLASLRGEGKHLFSSWTHHYWTAQHVYMRTLAVNSVISEMPGIILIANGEGRERGILSTQKECDQSISSLTISQCEGQCSILNFWILNHLHAVNIHYFYSVSLCLTQPLHSTPYTNIFQSYLSERSYMCKHIWTLQYVSIFWNKIYSRYHNPAWVCLAVSW